MDRRKNSLLDMEHKILGRKQSDRGKSSLSHLEDQMAIVGGRKRITPSGTLQKMEDSLLGRSRGRLAAAKSYDAGTPIELRYRRTHFTVMPAGHSAAAASWAANQALAGTEPYTVESFEADLANPSDTKPICQPVPSAPVQDATSQVARPADPASPVAASSGSPAAPADKPVPAPEQQEETITDNKAIATVAPALGRQLDDFEADIRAMADQNRMDKPAQAEPESAPETAAQDGHLIFDQMGRNMQYANTFNLGAIELDQRFDAFERELNQEEEDRQSGGMVTGLNLSADLDDIDILADIVQISDKAAVKKVKSDQGAAETGARVVLTDGGDQEEPEKSAIPAKPPPHTETNQPAAPARLAAVEDRPTEVSPPVIGEEKPSMGVRNPGDEFEASRQGTIISNY